MLESLSKGLTPGFVGQWHSGFIIINNNVPTMCMTTPYFVINTLMDTQMGANVFGIWTMRAQGVKVTGNDTSLCATLKIEPGRSWGLALDPLKSDWTPQVPPQMIDMSWHRTSCRKEPAAF